MHVMTDKMYRRPTSYTTSCITYIGVVNSGCHTIFIIVTTVIGDTCNLWRFVFFCNFSRATRICQNWTLIDIIQIIRCWRKSRKITRWAPPKTLMWNRIKSKTVKLSNTMFIIIYNRVLHDPISALIFRCIINNMYNNNTWSRIPSKDTVLFVKKYIKKNPVTAVFYADDVTV